MKISYRHTIGWFFLLIAGCFPAAFQTGTAQPDIYVAVENYRFGAFEDARALSLSTDGRMTVVDGGAGAVIRLDQTGKIERSLDGKGWGQLEFDQPVDGDANPPLRTYIADYGNARIQIFDQTLNFVATLDGRSLENDGYRFRYPRSIAISRHNDIFVLDGDNARIVKIDISGVLQIAFGGFDAGKGRLLDPSRIRISSNDVLGVIDRNDVLFFDLYGNYLSRYEGQGLVRACAPFTSDSRWIVATDSGVTIVDPDPDDTGTGCTMTGNILFEFSGGSPVGQGVNTKPVFIHLIRDIVARENSMYVLTNREIVVWSIAYRK